MRYSGHLASPTSNLNARPRTSEKAPKRFRSICWHDGAETAIPRDVSNPPWTGCKPCREKSNGTPLPLARVRTRGHEFSLWFVEPCRFL